MALASSFDITARDFSVPDRQVANRPIEVRGLPRDQVRLMVAESDGIAHQRFAELARNLRPGDLLVFNNSATIPASVVVDDSLVIHFSTLHPGGFVVVEPRVPDGFTSKEWSAGIPPRLVAMPCEAELDLLAPYPMGSDSSRMWLAQFRSELGLHDYLDRWGRPIRYSYVDDEYPLSSYQTIFSTVPGSAEMPSAGRPFSDGVLSSLVASGVVMAPLTLHTGVSSLESNEPPYPEWAEVPSSTADLVNHAKATAGRVIAIGTTVVRALESAVDRRGVIHPFRGWTDLLISPGHPIGAVDGLITGWHQPESSHLSMLEAIAGRRLLAAAYERAIDEGYLWHEFGDSLLLLPGRS